MNHSSLLASGLWERDRPLKGPEVHALPMVLGYLPWDLRLEVWAPNMDP